MKNSSKYPEWVKALKAGDPIFSSNGSLYLTTVDHVTEHFVMIKGSTTRFPKSTMSVSHGSWHWTTLKQDTPERRGILERNEMFHDVQTLAIDIGRINQYRELPMGNLEFLKEHMEVITTYMKSIGCKK